MRSVFWCLVLSLQYPHSYSSVVLHEFHSPQVLGPLTSYSSLAVTKWTVPRETRLATWTIQTSSPLGCSSANITM